MSRHRDTDDWRPSQVDSGRSSDFVGTGFGQASRTRPTPVRRRKVATMRWIVAAASLALALAAFALIRAFLFG